MGNGSHSLRSTLPCSTTRSLSFLEQARWKSSKRHQSIHVSFLFFFLAHSHILLKLNQVMDVAAFKEAGTRINDIVRSYHTSEHKLDTKS